MAAPSVFVSYSREDTAEKNQLLTQLGVIQGEDLIAIWSDDRIGAGAHWKDEIEQAMAQASVAILLVTAHFLTSKFIRITEVPVLLQRRAQEGLRVYPIIARPCPWKRVGWLAAMNVRPTGGKPVWRSGGRYAEQELAEIADEIATIVESLSVEQPTAELRDAEMGRRRPRAGAPVLDRDGATVAKPVAADVEENPARPAPRTPTVLLDQAHGQGSWHLPPTIEQGYRRVAELAAKHGHPVRASAEKSLPSADELGQNAVVVLVNAPHGRFQLTEEEVDAVQRYVADGGGLMALSTYTGDWHHESNLNRVLEGFGLEFNRDLIMPATADVNAERDDGRRQVYDFRPDSAYTVCAVPAGDDSDQGGDPSVKAVSAGVRTVLTLSSCSVATRGDARTVLRSGGDSKTFEPLPLGVTSSIDRWEVRRSGAANLLAVSVVGAGRVAAVGGWKMFLDRFIDRAEYDNERLFENLLLWLAARD